MPRRSPGGPDAPGLHGEAGGLFAVQDHEERRRGDDAEPEDGIRDGELVGEPTRDDGSHRAAENGATPMTADATPRRARGNRSGRNADEATFTPFNANRMTVQNTLIQSTEPKPPIPIRNAPATMLPRIIHGARRPSWLPSAVAQGADEGLGEDREGERDGRHHDKIGDFVGRVEPFDLVRQQHRQDGGIRRKNGEGDE
jgi:hypothetical protein